MERRRATGRRAGLAEAGGQRSGHGRDWTAGTNRQKQATKRDERASNDASRSARGAGRYQGRERWWNSEGCPCGRAH